VRKASENQLFDNYKTVTYCPPTWKGQCELRSRLCKVKVIVTNKSCDTERACTPFL